MDSNIKSVDFAVSLAHEKLSLTIDKAVLHNFIQIVC
jgi:hypothetical protein